MLGKPAKGSSFIITKSTVRPHRRPRVGFALLMQYVSHGMGDTLYYVGARAERARNNAWRAIRHGAKKAWRASRAALRTALAAVSDKLLEVGEDIAAPFAKLFRSVRSLFIVIKSSSSRGFGYTMQRIGAFFKYGWMWNKPVITRALNFLLPVVSLALCVAVIVSMLSLNYVLKVDYNGQTVGYVSDETVYDGARKIIENRMVASDNKNWGEGATMSIAVVDSGAVVTQDEMAEALLSVSGEEIAQATGLYVGGTFIGATTAGDLLADELDTMLAPYRQEAVELGSDVTVKFARDAELVRGVYPAESILPYDDLVAIVRSQEADDIYYIAKGGESAAEVAAKNGISHDRLLELNGAVDETLAEGKILLVAQHEPLLRVKTVMQEVDVVPVAFQTLYVRDPRFEVGYLWTKTEGENGERTIVSEIEYENGEEIGTVELSNTITRAAVDKEVIIGSRRADGTGEVAVGTSILTWPTGSGYGISRGYVVGGHQGEDIWAAHGTPIFAADNGVVTVSQWTDTGYGYYIIIDHQNGMQTVYAHCSELYVEVGDTVAKGEAIAEMGSTGNSTGTHLHFEVRVNGQKVDPEIYLMADMG